MDSVRESRVRGIFDSANFIRDLGMELTLVEEGVCETSLVPRDRHMQQHGFVHAGVLATLADHTAGCAARSVVADDHDVLTIEFKMNYLRPAIADRLRCRAVVLRGGKNIVVTEAEVFVLKGSEEKLACKGIFTVAIKRSLQEH
jgi:uncharacterized protein (TIGR00369 family)